MVSLLSLEHLSPEKAARYFRTTFDPELRRKAPLDKAFEILGWPVEHISGRDWTHGNDCFGFVDFDKGVVIIRTGDIPLTRQRFTEGHELGHLVMGDKPTYVSMANTLARGRAKELRLRGVGAPLRFQWREQNRRADLFAETLLVPDEVIRQDIRQDRDKKTFPELCISYGVSGWTMACSIVRATPEPCLALAFTGKGPVAPMRANEAAVNSGLFERILREFFTRRRIDDWPKASAALRSRDEGMDDLDLNGYVLKQHFIPADRDHFFFLRGRDNPIEVIGIFRQDISLSKSHRVPGTPGPFGTGELCVIHGLPKSNKTKVFNDMVVKRRHDRQRAQVFDMFGDASDSKAGNILTDRTGVELLERVRSDTGVVAIDNVQFGEKEFFYALRLLLSQGKDIIASGLDLDFRGVPWPVTAQLVMMAEPGNRTHCETPCEWPGCKRQARGPQLVGEYPDDVYHVLTEKDLFKAVCEEHWKPHPINPAEWPQELFPNI